MEETNAAYEFLINLANRGGAWAHIITVLAVIGTIYTVMAALRTPLEKLVNWTKTDKDNKVYNFVYHKIFPLMDKFGFGKGKLEEYKEDFLRDKGLKND